MKVFNVTDNIYERRLFLLIFSLVFGGIGYGGFQLTRVLSVIFFPLLYSTFSEVSDVPINKIRNVFLFWGVYNVISLIWTSNVIGGIKEVCYYITHFALFLEIVIFSRKCDNPLKTISKAGTMALAVSLVVALWEILTDNHLAVSKWDTAIEMSYYGEILLHHFASVTFGNYNTYVVYIVMCFPFALYSLLCLEKKMRALSIISILFSIYVILVNGSRGGVLCFSIFFTLFVILSYKRLHYVYLPVAFVLILFLFLVFFWEKISGFFMMRAESGFNDASRWEIWGRSLQLFASSYGFGTGVGSLATSMAKISRLGTVLVCHNAFLEILVQYGIIIFLWCVLFFVKLIRTLRWNEDTESKIVIICTLCMMPSLAIIDSGYMLFPPTWAFVASLYVFATNSFWKNAMDYQSDEEISLT